MSDELKNILRQFQLKQTNAVREAQITKESIYSELPEIKKIDENISDLALSIARTALSETNINLDELRKNLESLYEKKKIILEKNGYSLSDFDIKYNCSSCKDTGYSSDGSRCECLNKLIINKLYENSNLDNILNNENFDNFDIDIFSDEKYKDYKKSPRENMFENLLTAQDYCSFHKKNIGQNLIFFGSTGLGKTYLSNCIAKFFLDKGFSVVYQTAFELFDIISDKRFNNLNPQSNNADEKYKAIFNCDLLIIDDLGTESVNSFTLTELFNIVNSRIISKKRTIISTNLSMKKFSEIYTERIFSRIAKYYDTLFFYGNDLRIN